VKSFRTRKPCHRFPGAARLPFGEAAAARGAMDEDIDPERTVMR
jgi:hypothetical protein